MKPVDMVEKLFCHTCSREWMAQGNEMPVFSEEVHHHKNAVSVALSAKPELEPPGAAINQAASIDPA
jgi:hypothetical protein